MKLTMKKQFLLVLSLAVLFLGLARVNAFAVADDADLTNSQDTAGSNSTSGRNKAPLDEKLGKNKLDDLERRVEMLSEDMRYLHDKVRDLERSIDNMRTSSRP